MSATRKRASIVLSLGLILALPAFLSEAVAQYQAPPPEIPEALSPENREAIHLTTIGTYSAGFVLQSFGYIGVLADVLSQGVYEPDVVRSMLGETVTYLNNARAQLTAYQDQNFQISKGDQSFIDSIRDIIQDLIAEAEALSAFTEAGRSEELKREDLKRFEGARAKAWAGIKKTLGVK